MAPGAIKLKNIASVTANGVTATNILGFKEEHVMNITPQFVPNTYQGLGILERAKWRILTITLDSDSTVFDASWRVGAINTAIGTAFTVKFNVADAASTVETWTYTTTKSFIQKKEGGRVEDGQQRNLSEYSILMYGTKGIA